MPVTAQARRAAPETLYARELGAVGPVMAFLPGVGGTTRYWSSRVESLARDHRLILVDLLGFGRSPKPWVRYTVERHVEAVAGVLGGRGPMCVVGHSFGAMAALAYAARYPAQVDQLVLLSLPCFGSEARALDYFRRGPPPDRWLMTNLVMAAMTCVVTRRVIRPVLPRLLPDMPREVLEDLVQHTWRSFTSTLWEGVYRHDPAQDADRLRPDIPVLLIHGDRDPTAPLEAVRRLSAGRAGWTLLVLPGIDHHPLLRTPAWCVSVIEAWSAPTALPVDRSRRPGQDDREEQDQPRHS